MREWRSPICESVKMRHSPRRVFVGMSYKTIPDVDDGFGDRPPACREYTLPCANQNSRIYAYATIPGQTLIGPVLQVDLIRHLGISGIEIQILSTTTKERTSWVVMCRGRNRNVSRPQSHKFWITFEESHCKRR